MINGRGRGIDASGNLVPWDGRGSDTVNWVDHTAVLFDNHPCLRSQVTHENIRHWPVPTIVVCSHHFGFRPKRNVPVTTRTLYSVYKGVCQYCLNKIPFREATKDHFYPKSKGGSNDDFNLVLACRSCNSHKADVFPYSNVEGEEVVPKKLNKLTLMVPDNVEFREEWRDYLFHL